MRRSRGWLDRGQLGFSLTLALMVALTVTEGVAPGKGRRAARVPRARAQADRLVAEGSAALSARDFPGAYRAFSQAYRAYPGAEALYHLGALAWAEGRAIEAHDLLRRFLAESAAGAEAPEHREAQRILKTPVAPSGEVTVIGEKGAFVLLDDRLVGVLPLGQPLLVSAGDHKIALELGSRRLDWPVKVLPGRLCEMRFQVGAGVVVVTQMPALLLLRSFAGLAPEAQQQLQQGIEQAARRERVALLSPGAPPPSNCVEAPCLTPLAEQAGVQHVVTARAASRDGRWQLGADLFDAAVGDYGARVERACAGCSAEEAGTMLGELMGQAWQRGSARPRGVLEVLAPPEAEVSLDGRSVGPGPYRRAAWAGAHEVLVTRRGHRPFQSQVDVTEGQQATLEVRLLPDEPPPAPIQAPPAPMRVVREERGPRPRWRLALGVISLAGGGALLGFGVPAMAIDGRCIDERSCPTVYDTLGPGLGLSAAGAALLAGGALLLALPPPRRRVEILVDPRTSQPVSDAAVRRR